MSHLVSESEISARLGYKILLAGLSEAGKTAVKRIFFLRQQTDDVDNLSATLNYERLILNVAQVPITIVDLGGQRVFLKRFLGNFSPFIFNSVKAFIFLIDVENKTTRNNSIQYFISCVERLESFSKNAHFYVFLHKNDLVQHLPNYENIHEQLKEQFQLDCSQKISFFRTTIYRPETVIDAFGRIFEITMPDLAKSDYVDGRKIGQIEEYGETFVTVVPTAVQERTREISTQVLPPVTPEFDAATARPSADVGATMLTQLKSLMIEKTDVPSTGVPKTPVKVAGDSSVLSKLQGLMQEGTTKQDAAAEPIAESVPYLSSMAAEETTSETILAPQQEVTTAEPVTPAEPSQQGVAAAKPISPEAPLQLEDDIAINKRISHLIHFYGIEADEATAVAKSGYTDVFEVAATSRIPIPLVLDFLLKYIPFIVSEGLEVATLSNDRLLDVLGAHLRGQVPEDKILSLLVIAAKKPQWGIDKIVQKSFALPKIEIEAAKKERKKKKKVVVAKPRKKVQILVPVESESQEGILTFPDSHGIGFNIELTEDSNCRLFFYQQGHPIGNSLVSSKITAEELMYLLYYEMHLPFEGGLTAVDFVARIIHSAIMRTVAPSSIEAPDAVTPSSEIDKIQFIIPIDIATEEGFMELPDSQDVAVKVMMVDDGFLVMFKQRGHDIGQTTISKPMSARQLVSLMHDVMLLPIESEIALDFAGKIIIAAFKRLREAGISTSAAIEKHVPKKDDDTSDELMRYLEALRD